MVDFTDPSFRKNLANLIEDLRADGQRETNGSVNDSNKMSFHDLRDQQSISFREEIIVAISEDIAGKAAIRKRFSTFYIWFLTCVTMLIFYIIIDPINMLSKQSSFYSDTLKIALVGTFFATLLSAFMAMVKYGFTAEKQMIELFDLIGNEPSKGKEE